MSKEKRFENLSFFEALAYAKNNKMIITRASWHNRTYSYNEQVKELVLNEDGDTILSLQLNAIEANNWIAFN